MKSFITLKLALLVVFLASCTTNQNNEEVDIQDYRKPDLKNLIGRDFWIDDQHSYIGFRIEYFGNSKVRGRFDEFNGTIFYDSLNKEISSTLIINAASINTGEPKRDKDLKSGSWFQTEKYPSIKFQSITFINRSSGINLKGNLTIKGVTKEIILPLNQPSSYSKDWAGNDQINFTGEITINRRDFAVEGDGFWNEVMENGIAQLANEVVVEFEIHARRTDYSVRKGNKELVDSMAMILSTKFESIENDEISDLTKWVGENTVNYNTLYDLGFILFSEKRYNEALMIFELMVEQFPARISDHNVLGVLHLLLGESPLAKNEFRQVLEKDSLNAKAMEYLRHIEADH